MNCQRFEALLTDYLEGALTQDETALMEQHEKGCPLCAEEAKDMRQLLQDLTQMDDSAQVPAEWSQSWRQAIQKEERMQKQQESGKPAPVRSGWRTWVSVAAAALFLTVGTLSVQNWVPMKEGSRQSTQNYWTGDTYGYTENESDGGDSLYRSESSSDMAAPAPMAGSGISLKSAEAPQSNEQDAAEAIQGVKIIRTASYTLRTMKFDQDLESIKALTSAQGGWVEYVGVSGDITLGDTRYANLTLRIPAEKLDTFKSGVTQIGRVTDVSESASDVSESYADTTMRLNTQKVKMERLLALMENSGRLEDLLAVENAIADTQYQIDSYESTLKGLDSRINYSNVSVYLQEETAKDIANEKNLTLGERLQKGLMASLEAIGQFFQDMIVFLAMILPVALPLGVLIAILTRVLRRRKMKKQQNNGGI